MCMQPSLSSTIFIPGIPLLAKVALKRCFGIPRIPPTSKSSFKPVPAILQYLKWWDSTVLEILQYFGIPGIPVLAKVALKRRFGIPRIPPTSKSFKAVPEILPYLKWWDSTVPEILQYSTSWDSTVPDEVGACVVLHVFAKALNRFAVKAHHYNLKGATESIRFDSGVAEVRDDQGGIPIATQISQAPAPQSGSDPLQAWQGPRIFFGKSSNLVYLRWCNLAITCSSSGCPCTGH